MSNINAFTWIGISSKVVWNISFSLSTAWFSLLGAVSTAPIQTISLGPIANKFGEKPEILDPDLTTYPLLENISAKAEL